MTRKVARQSEVTPLNTIDNYLWNERLGVTQLPPVDPTNMSQGQPNLSSVPPDASQASPIDFGAANGENDMFGSGVDSEGRQIAPKAPVTTPASVPARSKAAAISTLYGDVNPTPTTGESSGNSSQPNPNNSSNHLPKGPDSSPVSPAAAGEEEGGAGLAASLGEDASLALLASKYRIGSALDPIVAKFKYIRHNKKTGKWEIWQRSTGKTLSTHDSEAEAEKAFRGMETGMHGG